MSTIVRIEVGRFDYDFVGEFKFFKPGPDGVVRRPSVLLRITDEDGRMGWGQAVPVPTWTYETVESVQSTLETYLAPAVLGADPADFEDIHERMEHAIKPAFTVGQPLSKAAIDMACYDLAGVQQEKPVYELLGGAEMRSLKLNWTVNSMDMAVVEEQLEQGRARGYRHYTVKVGPPQTPEYDLALIKKIREYAPESFLWADANTGYSLDTALETIPRLADAGLQVLELPLPPHQFRGYQALMRQGAVRIFMDEGIISPAEVAEFIALGMFDGITMKPARCAGIFYSQQIIRMLKDNHLAILGSGLTDPDISLAAALHLFAWAGITRPCALNGPQFLANTLVASDFLPSGGEMRIPDGPGFGVEMSEQAEAVLKIAAER